MTIDTEPRAGAGTQAPADLLSRPHHDGSALYVSNLHPRLGDSVQLRVRVPNESPPSAVHMRLVPDAELMFVDAVLYPVTETETWWRAEVTGRSMSRPGCWVHTGDDGLVFLSERKEQTALGHGARTAQDPIQVPSRHLTGVAGAHTAYGCDLIQSATA